MSPNDYTPATETTLSGAPKHPLARGQHRIPDDQEPMQWWPSENATPPGQTGGDR